jgi:hypothetical protein
MVPEKLHGPVANEDTHLSRIVHVSFLWMTLTGTERY